MYNASNSNRDDQQQGTGYPQYTTQYGQPSFSQGASYQYQTTPTTAQYGAIAPPSASNPPTMRPDGTYAYSNERTAAAYGTAMPGYGAGSYSSAGSVWTSPGLPSTATFDYGETRNPDYSQMGYEAYESPAGTSANAGLGEGKSRSTQRRPSNRDEFDGPHQYLARPPPGYVAAQDMDMPHLPTNLAVQEQDSVLTCVQDRLSQCAYDFIAKWQFPVPVTENVRPVERAADREWSEWVYLLKRLATKRRIPTRVLYNGQIKQLVTTLENSLEMRQPSKHHNRPLKDDRNILQLISAGIQVAKILKDAEAMKYLNRLYENTEAQIKERTSGRHRR